MTTSRVYENIPAMAEGDITIKTNAHLVSAFPSMLRADVLTAIAAIPEGRISSATFSVQVAGETLHIPQRIYHNPLEVSARVRLRFANRIQSEIVDCLLTRHSDGLLRQERLSRIVQSKNIRIPPFVVQLASEYVIDILHVIDDALPHLNTTVYSIFLRENPDFVALTKQRIISYWNCYYRTIPRDKYPGFRILNFLEALTLG